jgi:hypothetical protein
VAFASAAITLGSSAAIFVPMLLRKRLSAQPLLIGGVFYLVYLGVVVAALVRPGG